MHVLQGEHRLANVLGRNRRIQRTVLLQQTLQRASCDVLHHQRHFPFFLFRVIKLHHVRTIRFAKHFEFVGQIRDFVLKSRVFFRVHDFFDG